MSRQESKDRIAWYRGYSYWNPDQIIFEQGIIGYLRMLKESNRLYQIINFCY